MDAIKKKMATLKEEKETAIERAEDAEKEKKEADARADGVSKRKYGERERENG